MRAREWLDQKQQEQREEAFLELLIHQFERRLQRDLTSAEHETVRERLDALGPEQVSDVVLDSSPEELEAWLAGDTSE